MKLRMLCALVLAGTCVMGGCSKKDTTPVAAVPPGTPTPMPGVTPTPPATDPAAQQPVAVDPFAAAPGTEPAAPAFPTDPATPAVDPFAVEPAKPAATEKPVADPFAVEPPAKPAATEKPVADPAFPEPEVPAVKPAPKPAKPAPVERTWTLKSGRTAQATFVKFEDGKVTIVNAAGTERAVPLDSFSDADQEYVKQMTAP